MTQDGPLWNRLPDTWSVSHVGRLAEVTLGKMLQPADGGGDFRAPYLRAANVQPDGRLQLDDVNEMWFRHAELRVLNLRAGDVVVVEGGQGGFGRAAFLTAPLDGWGFQNSINRLRPRPEVDGRFVAYYLIALRASGFIRAYCNIVSMPHLTAEKLAAIPIPLPPTRVQGAIAEYLDRETTQIDTLIAKQEQLIATLRERRNAVLSAVLDHESWDVPLRSVSSLVQTGPFGSQLKSDEYVDEGIPVINPSHIVASRILPDPRVGVSVEKAAELGRHSFQIGDVVVARRGELARCAVVEAGQVGYLCGTGSAIIRVCEARLRPSFLALAYGADRNRDALQVASVGSTMDSVNANILGSLRVPVPALARQDEIMGEVRSDWAKIDALIGKGERFIELAKERRLALIAAAVTGQIDVPVA